MIVGADGVSTRTYDLGTYTDTAAKQETTEWSTIYGLVMGTTSDSKWATANGAKSLVTAQGINASANINGIKVDVAVGGTNTYQFIFAK